MLIYLSAYAAKKSPTCSEGAITITHQHSVSRVTRNNNLWLFVTFLSNAILNSLVTGTSAFVFMILIQAGDFVV